jgi:HlyD family secretion protein
MKKSLKYIVIVVVIIAAVVVYTQVRKRSNRPEWKTVSPSTGTIREVVTATGALNPYVLVEVGTEVSGKIEKLYKDFNQTVRKGELLARLDTEILLTSLESARADLNKATISRDEAQMDYNIAKDLYDKSMTSEYEMKKAEFTFKQAQQNLATANLKLQTAQKNLDNASITSPIDGVIVARNVNEGQTVAASFSAPTLFTIANNLDKMQITANVDEADIGKIKKGLPVEFSVDAYAGEQFDGTVEQIRLNATTEQNVVSYSVIIDTDNPGHKLLPGMTTNVSIIVQSKENVLRIPETATRFSPSKEVWELFGLKWEDDLISTARKKAMETAMAKMKQAAEGSSDPATGKVGTDTLNKAFQAGNTARTGRSGYRGKPGASADSTSARSSWSGSSQASTASRSGIGMVWVLKGKTPELTMVRTGVSDGAYVEVVGEIDSSLKIITGVEYKDPSQASGNSAIQSGPGMGPRF